MASSETAGNISESRELGNFAWYLRRGKTIRGPFPEGLISRYILLGRIRMSDEVSHDQIDWRPVSEHPDLVPPVMKADMNDTFARERLEAARRWADERKGRTSEGEGVVDDRRRHTESVDVQAHRLFSARTSVSAGGAAFTQRYGKLLVVSVVVIFILASLVYWPAPAPQEQMQCGQFPRPGVNWNSCHLEGSRLVGVDLGKAHLSNTNLSRVQFYNTRLVEADLSYSIATLADFRGSDLRGARLTGAILRGANLAGAQLAYADLSYANLANTELAGADFTGAVLDNAIWVNGETCQPGSVGECRLAVQPSGK